MLFLLTGCGRHLPPPEFFLLPVMNCYLLTLIEMARRGRHLPPPEVIGFSGFITWRSFAENMPRGQYPLPNIVRNPICFHDINVSNTFA
jgi:hypothetical protein